MDDQILLINTRVPARVRGFISRPRLVEEIERGLDDAKIVLVSAPAGYGKTALLTDWARTTDRRVAWVTIEGGQEDPERFVRHLATAWRVVDPELSGSGAGLLLELMSADIDLVTRALVNYAAISTKPVTFVLDDLDNIRDPASCDVLTFFVEHLPADFQLVAAYRSEPSLPLSRFRVRQRVHEIGAAQLAFRREETQSLVTHTLGRSIDSKELASMQEASEGWVAALQLFARTGRVHGGIPDLPPAGRHEIAAYLQEEVLAGLDREQHAFLEQVSLFDQICPSLCDAVIGGDASRVMLEALERANLFLQPLDTERHWYRLHPLMSEAVRRGASAAPKFDVMRLHVRAAHWFLEQRMIDQAFRHAVAGGDRELAARIAESYTVVKAESGEYRTIQKWLELVPAAWYAECPELNILPVVFSVFSGDVDAALRIVNQLDDGLTAVTDRAGERFKAKLAVVRCAIACFMDEVPKAEAYAATALRDLDAGDVTYRANTHHALADTYRRHGRWSEARSHYLQVLDFPTDPAFTTRSAHVYGALADLELRQGRLRSAASYWQKEIVTIRDQVNWGKLPAPIIGWAFIRHGELLYEWNQLDEAKGELERGLERAELGGDTRAMIAGYLLASRLRLAAEDSDGATDYLEQAATLVERARYPEWLSRVDRMQALLLVHRNDAAAGLNWCHQVGFGDALQDRPDSQEAFLGLAQLLIQFGGDAERPRARKVLADLLRLAEVEGRRGIQVEALALDAIERQSAGHQSEALISFDKALRLAEPEWPVRLLVDLGPPVRRLLQSAAQRGALTEYGSLLLAASTQATRLPGDPMVESLSDRELEILRLVAAGLTNREVGDRLYIADETVKKHLANIYGKLQVHRRIEAAVRARELGLLR